MLYLHALIWDTLPLPKYTTWGGRGCPQKASVELMMKDHKDVKIAESMTKWHCHNLTMSVFKRLLKVNVRKSKICTKMDFATLIRTWPLLLIPSHPHQNGWHRLTTYQKFKILPCNIKWHLQNIVHLTSNCFIVTSKLNVYNTATRKFCDIHFSISCV